MKRRVNLLNTTHNEQDEMEVLCNAVSSLKTNRDKQVTWEDGKDQRRRFQSPSPDRSRSRYQTPPRKSSPARFNCPFCESQDHTEDECKLYNDRNLYWQHIQRKRWCSNCLRTGHRWRDCFKEQSCKLSCNRVDKHVSVLCDQYYKD